MQKYYHVSPSKYEKVIGNSSSRRSYEARSVSYPKSVNTKPAHYATEQWTIGRAVLSVSDSASPQHCITRLLEAHLPSLVPKFMPMSPSSSATLPLRHHIFISIFSVTVNLIRTSPEPRSLDHVSRLLVAPTTSDWPWARWLAASRR